jgi:hypothetical protein
MGNRTRDLPACSIVLYQLHYSGYCRIINTTPITFTIYRILTYSFFPYFFRGNVTYTLETVSANNPTLGDNKNCKNSYRGISVRSLDEVTSQTSQNKSVCVARGSGLESKGFGSRQRKGFLSLNSVQTRFGIHPASYSTDNRCFSHGVKRQEREANDSI